jgi:dipeptidyl aminopeptidase/acylaminoacyl peptidase
MKPATLFMLAVALSLCLLAGLTAPTVVRAAEPVRSAVPVEPFFRHADYRELALSPSGKYLGALVPVDGRVRLSVIDLDAKTAKVVASMRGEDISSFAWVNDSRLVFSLIDLQSGLAEQRAGGLFAIDRDGTNFRILAPTIRELIVRGQIAPRFTFLHDVPGDGSDDIFVDTNENDVDYVSIYRMNTRTGRKTALVDTPPGDVVGWLLDRKGQARAAVTSEKKGLASRVYWRAGAGDKWTSLGEFGLSDRRILPAAFDGDGSLVVASDVGRDTLALYRYDTTKMATGELLAAHPQNDLGGGLVFDRRKNAIVGVAYDGAKPGAAWFDDDYARVQKTIDAALPDRMNEIRRADAGPRALVFSYSDTDPGSYYLYDTEKRQLEFVAAVRKGIKPDAMPRRQPVRYAARDGLEIPGYLTLPRTGAAKNLPLVLYVHGGPYVRGSHWGWSAEPAYLAALGYAVLEPEFRGSTGWGAKHFRAGWKAWGLAMQDDLVDGIDWLAKEGTIDPKRVCIMGASYGGYAVMMGLARDPDRFRCGINYVGVTDIALMFEVTWSDFARSNYIEYAAKDLIGDPDKDAARFKATSPLANAAKIRAPVLMAYGGGDRRVPIVHGEQMRAALEKQGTPVEWVAYPEEGHGFILEATRYDFYGRVAKFLAKHLPVD